MLLVPFPTSFSKSFFESEHQNSEHKKVNVAIIHVCNAL